MARCLPSRARSSLIWWSVTEARRVCFLTVRAQAAAKVCESLERYIIVDDAVITNESAALVQLGVYGAAARAVVLGDAGAAWPRITTSSARASRSCCVKS
jgi:folate-binding Fe-S cluster repair protein YgfZ